MIEAHTLTADGALVLHVDLPSGNRADAVRRWRPGSARPVNLSLGGDGASITVQGEAPFRSVVVERGTPILTFGGVTAELRSADSIVLLTSTPGCGGELRLGARCATVALGSDEGAMHAAPMLTLAAALLLGRMGRALVHGAAAVTPRGEAWLLIGDTHSGKTTTCATLLDGGWRYCSDDQVVLSRAEDGSLEVEGWPRAFHLDRGYAAQRATGGVRDDVDATERWPGRRAVRAPVAGTLFPTVDSARPTTLAPIDAAARLAGIVRQSPWLFADAGTASSTLALLRELALLPGHDLRLGGDSFARPERMADVLRAATG